MALSGLHPICSAQVFTVLILEFMRFAHAGQEFSLRAGVPSTLYEKGKPGTYEKDEMENEMMPSP